MLVAALSRLARSSGDKEGGPLPFVAVALLLVTAGVAALALNPTWGVLAGAFFTHLVVTYVVIDLFVRMLGIDSTEPSSTADRRSPSGEARPRPTLLESTPDRRFISIAARASGA